VLRLDLPSSGRILEVRSVQLPDGGLVTTYTDATAHVQSEQELEAENEKLERRVRERTDELVRLNEELAGAKAAAEEANLSKTRFLAAASHDLLQPLNAARLYATSLNERMSDGKSVPDTLSLAQNIDASLEAVEEILTALLDISRLDAGAMKPEIGAVRIDDIFRQLEVEFGPSAREQRIALTFSPCSLAVRSDRRLLRRLLQNLVSNAIKYTPNGRVLVGVRRKGARLRIEVHDTGIGIPAAKQRVVFQEFERLEAAVKTARGAGLGLSIVERLSRVLEHPITLVSEPDRGSVFSLEIPRDTGFAVAEAGVAHPPALHRPLAGMTVGAIDNDPQILAGMATLLEGWGCHVVGAADGAALAARLAEVHQRPDVIVADYHLDESDGLLAIDLLRESFGADLPAVLVTADRSVEVRERAGLHDVRLLTKPLKPAALRALLSQWRVIETAAE
jgi:signal transduction histidine kinase